MRLVLYHFRVLKAIISVNFKVMSVYRASLLASFMANIAFFVTNIVFTIILFTNISDVGGWTMYEMLLRAGVGQAMFYGFFSIFAPGLWSIGSNVNSGNIDFHLLLPVNTRFYISLHQLNISQFFPLLAGIVLAVYSFIRAGIQSNIFSILFFAVLVVISVITLYNIFLICVSLELKFVRFSFLQALFFTMTSSVGQPLEIFSGLFKTFIVFIVPIGVLADYPVRWITRGLELWQIIYFLSLPVVTYLLSRWVFSWGLRNYRGASS